MTNLFPLPPEEIASKAMTLYRDRLQALLDTPEYVGQFVSIDITSGDYMVGEKHMETSRLLRQRHPNAVIYTLRIGYPAAVSMSGRLQASPAT
jgi:hypothetical protein